MLFARRDGRSLAYLTDTVGVPAASVRLTLDTLVLDCSMAPQAQVPRNHNDLTRALEVIELLAPGRTWLTHIGQSFDA